MLPAATGTWKLMVLLVFLKYRFVILPTTFTVSVAVAQLMGLH
jgi:hypothetical protein